MSNWAEVFDDLGFVTDTTGTVHDPAADGVTDWEQFLPEPAEGAADDALDGLLAQLVAAASDDGLADDLFVPRGERRAVASEPVAERDSFDDASAAGEAADDLQVLTADVAGDDEQRPDADADAIDTAAAPLEPDDVVPTFEFEPVVVLDDEPASPDEPLPLDDELF